MRHRCHSLASPALAAALCLVLTLCAIVGRAAHAQATPSAVRAQPRAGEIELRGTVQAILPGERRLVLDAAEVALPDGTATPIDPPRPKTIVIGPQTILRDDTDAGAGRALKLADIKPDDSVAIVGKSAGEGKPMTARIVRTLEDPTAKRVNLLPPTGDPKAWTFGTVATAKGTIAADENALKVEITDPGDTERSVHVGKGNLDITPGHTYLLRFRAKAAAPRPLRVISLATWPDRETGLNDTLDLEKGWKDYRIRFIANDPSPDKQNALDFWLGQKGGTIWIADASLKDMTRRVVRPVRDPLIAGLVYDLKSMDKFKRKGAADKLAAVAVIDESREAVADALISVFSDPDLFVRWAAVAAMRVWATPDTMPALIKKLSDPEHAVRWATMDSLGALKDRRAARPLAEMVARGQDRGFAAGALNKMGMVSEEVAVQLLTADAWEARMEACKILGQNGSRASLPALQAALRREDGIVRGAVEDAIRSISVSGR